jgi:ferredoxin
MIEIRDKKKCCGCSTCAQRCPRQCITLKEDHEGFLYPYVDITHCIDCKLCEKVCPFLQPEQEQKPLLVYAAIHKDESTRMQSSSGGIFSLLSEQVIARGGVVFGARFDEQWEVMHDYTETLEGLAAFRGSKYMQSRTGNSYNDAERFLKEGREVLFSGTPCQIAGLKHFLNKEYKRLLTVDLICHGVPSPKVWRMYLHALKPSWTVSEVNFRSKQSGWKRYSICMRFASPTDNNITTISHPFYEDVFMRGFLSNLYLRPSCYECQAKKGKSGSDITIADYWGIEHVLPEYDDDKGVGLVFLNTEHGHKNFPHDLAIHTETGYEEAVRYNGGVNEHIMIRRDRERFFAELDTRCNVEQLIAKYLKVPWYKKGIRLARRIILRHK